jgi:hypothetical protein
LRDDARQKVGKSAWRRRHNDFDRPRGIVLRYCPYRQAEHDRKGGEENCEKLHGAAPIYYSAPSIQAGSPVGKPWVAAPQRASRP